MPHRSTLHEDDRMVTVLARHGRGESQHESSLCLAGDPLEAVRREMVTLVHNQVPVVRYPVINDTSPNEALHHGDVEHSGWSASPAANAPNRFHRDAEEGRESLDPLVEQLAAVDQDQCIHTTLSNEPGGDHRLAEGRRSGQYTGFVLQQRV